jgi:hypothetical protein
MKFEDTEVGPCEFNVKFEYEPNASFTFECTELAVGYVRVAMLASKKDRTNASPLETRSAIEYTHWCKGRVVRGQRANQNEGSD